MEWGTPVQWGKFLLFCVRQSVKTRNMKTYPTGPGSLTPCKQALTKDFFFVLYNEVTVAWNSIKVMLHWTIRNDDF